MLVGVAALAVIATAGPARADDVAEAEALIRQGIELRQSSRDERALPLFEKAYTLARTPRTAGQLGLCELAVGYWLEAEKHLAESLAASDHPWVTKSRGPLREALTTARANIGEVNIQGPAGSDVAINGKRAGRLPLDGPLRLGKGPADLEVRATGYLPFRRALTVVGDERQAVRAELEKEPTPAVATTPGAPIPLPSGPKTDSDADAVDGSASAGTSHRRIVAWVGLAVTGAALAASIFETTTWLSRRDAFDNHVGPLTGNPAVQGKDCGSGEVNYGGAGCQQLHSDLALARTLSVAGYALTGALAVASVVLFATSSPPQSTKSVGLTCAPDLFTHGAACQLSF